MFRWMVALDGSDNAREAFYTTINLMDKRRDDLFLVSTVHSTLLSIGKELLAHRAACFCVRACVSVLTGFDGGAGKYQRYSDEIEATHKKYLVEYSRRCDEEGVRNYKPILARGSHVGRMICAAADQKGVDFLVVGRRGMNRLSRVVAGSTSKYLMENAVCNVIVVKGTHARLCAVCVRCAVHVLMVWRETGYFMAEERGTSLSEIQKLEEQERERRMTEFGKKEEHYCSRDEIKAIEERERLRRMRHADQHSRHKSVCAPPERMG
jgi:nucleotide-binding universal stress UspA family protein